MTDSKLISLGRRLSSSRTASPADASLSGTSDGGAKTLMNEVLPTPASTTVLRSTPRQRAIKRLKQLTATLGTTAAVILASCLDCSVPPEPVPCEDVSPADLLFLEIARRGPRDFEVVVTSLDSFVEIQGLTFNHDAITVTSATKTAVLTDQRGAATFTLTINDGATEARINVPVGCNRDDFVLVYTVAVDLEIGETESTSLRPEVQI